MPNENMTLLINPETRDLEFDDDGIMERIYDDETTMQSIRLTLQTWKNEFFLDTTHGTEYERILGMKTHELPPDEIGEVLREAIFQEGEVSQINSVIAKINGRTVESEFDATLYSGRIISMEVNT